MEPIANLEKLHKLRDDAVKEREKNKTSGYIRILVSMNSTSIASGSLRTFKTLQTAAESNQVANVRIVETGGIGLDSYEPVIQVLKGDQPVTTYGKVTPDAAKRILKEHIQDGKPLKSHLIPGWN